MKRLIVVTCIGVALGSLVGVAAAQPLSGTTVQPLPGATDRDDAPPPIKSVAAPAWTRPDPSPPPLPVAPAANAPSAPQLTPSTGSPGESQVTAETRAHELHLLQSQAAEESVHRAAVARADQRTRRLESQRWFGISNKRPAASVDPFDGDYAAYWASNYPYYPLRWVGSGEPWGLVETQP